MISPYRILRGAAFASTILVLASSLSACGSPGDGGWLAKGSGWAFFLQISGNSGTVDYAHTGGQSVNTDHAAVTINNDSTMTFLLTSLNSGGCPESCPYTINANTLVLSIPGATPLTFQSGTISQFEDARSNIQAAISSQANATATAQAQVHAELQLFYAQDQAKCEAVKGAFWRLDGNYGAGLMDKCGIYEYGGIQGIFFDIHGNMAPNACDDIATKKIQDVSPDLTGDAFYLDYIQVCSGETVAQAKSDCLNGIYFGELDLRGIWLADIDVCDSY